MEVPDTRCEDSDHSQSTNYSIRGIIRHYAWLQKNGQEAEKNKLINQFVRRIETFPEELKPSVDKSSKKRSSKTKEQYLSAFELAIKYSLLELVEIMVISKTATLDEVNSYEKLADEAFIEKLRALQTFQKELTENPKKINDLCYRGVTLFDLARSYNMPKIIQPILQYANIYEIIRYSAICDPEKPLDKDVMSALLKRIKSNPEEVLKEYASKANSEPSSRETPSYRAVKQQNISAIEEVLKEYASKETPLHRAIKQKNILAIEEVLKEYTSKETTLYGANKPKYISAIEEVLKEYTSKETPLYRAIKQKNISAIEEVLKEYTSKETPLYRAIKQKNISAIEVLVLNGNESLSNYLYTDEQKRDLNVSLVGTRQQFQNQLKSLDSYSKERLAREEEKKEHLIDVIHKFLRLSFDDFKKAIIKCLAQNPYAIYEGSFYENMTALHWATFYRLDSEIITLFLEKGANPYAKDAKGRTPISLVACKTYQLDDIEKQSNLLIESASLTEIVKRAPRIENKKALFECLIKRIRYYPHEINAVYCMNSQTNWTAADIAILNRDYETLEWLVLFARIDVAPLIDKHFSSSRLGVDEELSAQLEKMTHQDSLPTAKQNKTSSNLDFSFFTFLNKLAVYAQERQKRNYNHLVDKIHDSVLFYHPSTYTIIMQSIKADPLAINERGYLGRTPVHWAALYSCPEDIIKLLVEHGADITKLDVDGKCPADLADDDELKKLLSQLSNKDKKAQSKSSNAKLTKEKSLSKLLATPRQLINDNLFTSRGNGFHDLMKVFAIEDTEDPYGQLPELSEMGSAQSTDQVDISLFGSNGSDPSVEVPSNVKTAIMQNALNMLELYCLNGGDPNGVSSQKYRNLINTSLIKSSIESLLVFISHGGRLTNQLDKTGEQGRGLFDYLYNVSRVNVSQPGGRDIYTVKERIQFLIDLQHKLEEKRQGYLSSLSMNSIEELNQQLNASIKAYEEAFYKVEEHENNNLVRAIEHLQGDLPEPRELISELRQILTSKQNVEHMCIGLLVHYQTKDIETALQLLAPELGGQLMMVLEKVVVNDNFNDFASTIGYNRKALDRYFFYLHNNKKTTLLRQVIEYKLSSKDQFIIETGKVNALLISRKLAFQNIMTFPELFGLIKTANPDEKTKFKTLLANELHAFSVQFYQFVRLSDFKNQGWASEDTTSQEYGIFAYHKQMTKKFIHFFVQEVLECSSLESRRELLTFYISVLEHLVELKNYDAAMIINLAISHQALERLELLRDARTSGDSRKLFHRYEEHFKPLLSAGKNYSEMRKMMDSQGAEAIPFLGIFTKDLTNAIENQGINRLEMTGKVYAHLMAVMSNVAKMSYTEICFETNCPCFLARSPMPDDEKLYDLSYNIRAKIELQREMVCYSNSSPASVQSTCGSVEMPRSKTTSMPDNMSSSTAKTRKRSTTFDRKSSQLRQKKCDNNSGALNGFTPPKVPKLNFDFSGPLLFSQSSDHAELPAATIEPEPEKKVVKKRSKTMN